MLTCHQRGRLETGCGRGRRVSRHEERHCGRDRSGGHLGQKIIRKAGKSIAAHGKLTVVMTVLVLVLHGRHFGWMRRG